MNYSSKPTINEVRDLIRTYNKKYEPKYPTDRYDLLPNTIEEFWIPLWIFKDYTPMSPDSMKFFDTILKVSVQDLNDLIREISTSKDYSIKFNYKMIWESMNMRFNIKLDMRSKLWIWYQGFRPGILVMIYAYMRYRMHELSLDELDFETLNTRVFQSGFPSESFFEWIWDCQKLYDGSNLLDHGEAYRSIIENK